MEAAVGLKPLGMPEARLTRVPLRTARKAGADAAWAKHLERELRRKDKTLKEALALAVLSRKAGGLTVGGRGRFHGPDARQQVQVLIKEALTGGARLSAACRQLGISTRTVQRWRRLGDSEDRRPHARRQPANRLTNHERQQIMSIVHSEEFRGLSPRQIIPRLADQGRYLASESTFYRLLKAVRRETCSCPARTMASAKRSPEELVVTRPNQVWSWDISYLRGPERNTFLYLYIVIDVFSRRIMGWKIHLREAAEHASRLIRNICAENNIDPSGLVLHSDNGGPMKGATMVNMLRRLGIVPSFSRPRVSNDNAFAEALLHTIKGRPTYPIGGFSSSLAAEQWMAHFAAWYNGQHLHSSLGYVTPDARHSGSDSAILERRARLYQRAWSERPRRWPGQVRKWLPGEFPRVRVRARSSPWSSLPGKRPIGDNQVDIYRSDKTSAHCHSFL
jgi:putative transposase